MISINEEMQPLSVSRLKRLIQDRGKEVARSHAPTDKTLFSAYESGREIDEYLGDILGEKVPERLDDLLGYVPVFNRRHVFFNAYKAEIFKLRNPRQLTYLCRHCGKRLRPYTNRDHRIEYYGRSRSNYFCTERCGYSWAIATIQRDELKRNGR